MAGFVIVIVVDPEPVTDVGLNAAESVAGSPLTENVVITGALNAFSPMQGFRDIFTDKTLFSVAANVRFRF